MKKKSIQRGAHAATFLAVWWMLFSAFGVFDWLDMHRHLGDPNAIPDLVIWGIHLLVIGLAIYAWKIERARETLWIGEEDELIGLKPQDIDMEEEKANLKGNVIAQIKGTLWLIGWQQAYLYLFAPNSSPIDRFALPIFLGGLLLLNIILGLSRYAFLWCRVKAARSRD